MREIWVPISGAIASQRNVDQIANNVANANTPGFKKDQIVFKEYLASVERQDPNHLETPGAQPSSESFYHPNQSEDSFVKVDGTYTLHDQGQLTPTSNTFDFALNGQGFFEVLSPQGVRYSRKGNFTLNAEGKLVNDQGHYILSRGAPPVVGPDGSIQLSTPPESRSITIGNNKLTVSLDGEVYAGQNKVADLAVVEFNDLQLLKKEGNSLFVNTDPKNYKVGNQKTSVHQGFIEQSNVNAVSEMSQLINANRTFESIQRVIKTYDQMSNKAVNEIPKF